MVAVSVLCVAENRTQPRITRRRPVKKCRAGMVMVLENAVFVTVFVMAVESARMRSWVNHFDATEAGLMYAMPEVAPPTLSTQPMTFGKVPAVRLFVPVSLRKTGSPTVAPVVVMLTETDLKSSSGPPPGLVEFAATL